MLVALHNGRVRCVIFHFTDEINLPHATCSTFVFPFLLFNSARHLRAPLFNAARRFALVYFYYTGIIRAHARLVCRPSVINGPSVLEIR